MELPWSEPVARRVCDTFMVRASLSNYRPTLISFRQNAIFYISGPDISLRIYGPGEESDPRDFNGDQRAMAEGAEFPSRASVADRDRATLEFTRLPNISLAMDCRGRARTGRCFRFWAASTAVSRPARCGSPIGAGLHQMTRIRQRFDRIRAAEIISKEAEAVLAGVIGRAAAMANSLGNTRLGRGILHGDAMPGNAVQSRGEMVMIDLDSVCAGPREWDLVPMYVTSKRFFPNGERRWHAFLKGYGVNDGDLPDLQAASIIKQLSMTIYLCLSAGQSANIDAEIARRIRMWETRDLAGRWTTGFTI